MNDGGEETREGVWQRETESGSTSTPDATGDDSQCYTQDFGWPNGPSAKELAAAGIVPPNRDESRIVIPAALRAELRGDPTEHQQHVVEVPRGAVVTGMGMVFTLPDGSVGCRLMCAGNTKHQRQAFAVVMSKALANFKAKHELDDREVVGGHRISLAGD